MYAMVIDQDPLHFEVRLFAVLLMFKFDESILKAVACPFIADNFAGYDLAESTENQLQIFI